jgi:ankyrin repeat protein
MMGFGPHVETELMSAAGQGNLDKVRSLIGQGVDLDAVDEAGDTALYYAAAPGNVAVVTELLQGGSDPDLFGACGPALHVAVRTGHSEVVGALIAHGADANIRSQSGATPIMFAAGLGSDEVVRLLHARGADINARDRDGDSVLYYAASNAQATTVDLLFALGALPNSPMSEANVSPLVHAAMVCCSMQAAVPGRDLTDYSATVRALLRGGSDPDDLYRQGFALVIVNQNERQLVRRDHARSWLFEPSLSVSYLLSEDLRKSVGI